MIMIYVATVYVTRPDGEQRRTVVRHSALDETQFKRLVVDSPHIEVGTIFEFGPIGIPWNEQR